MTNSKTRDEAFEAWFAQQRTRFTNAPLSEKTKRLMEPAYLAGRRAALLEAAKVAYEKANEWHGHDGKYACEDVAAALNALADEGMKP